ncbi:MAG: nitronate monooxygenase, partial [Bacteroidia bacterium]|nr:nitronate monooxygenase [Bacteroidia bacterium]
VVAAGPDATMLALKSLTPVRLLKNQFFQTIHQLELQGANPEQLRSVLGKGRAKRGMFEGDLVEGELEIGQIAACVQTIEPAAEILRSILKEYQEIKQELTQSNHF